jgi:hypothetical protein
MSRRCSCLAASFDEATGVRQAHPRATGEERDVCSICEDDCTPVLEGIARRTEEALGLSLSREAATWKVAAPSGELGSHPLGARAAIPEPACEPRL